MRNPGIEVQRDLLRTLEKIESYQKFASGVQHNQHVIRLPDEERFLSIHINNLGDPFCEPKVPLDPHSFPQEREVVASFAELYGWDRSPDKTWGYVGSSGSEGNFSGIRYGREVLASKWNLEDKTKTTLLYASASHYSVPRAGQLLNIRLKAIGVDDMDALDIGALKRELESNLDFYRKNGVILSVTIGTTMTCAYDDFMAAKKVMEKLGLKKTFVHVDGALGGLVLPFIDNEQFKHADSLAVSGHKILGLPFPAGVFITKKEYWEIVKQTTEYISKEDGTLFGSRNGLAPLYLYAAVKEFPKKREIVKQLIELTHKIVENLKKNGVKAFCVKNGLAVCLPSVELEPGFVQIQEKYKLADNGRICHFFVMEQHLVQKHIAEEFQHDTIEYYEAKKKCEGTQLQNLIAQKSL